MREATGTWRRGAPAALCAGLAIALLATACEEPETPLFPPPGDAVPVASPDTVGPIRFQGRHLVDAAGRVVLIHGVNIVRKDPPFIYDGDWLGPERLEGIRRAGFNGVRLGVWAAALMPEPDVIDGEYLEAIAGAVELLREQGLWVLLDFHQDVFWGMPLWATSPEAAALSDEPNPVLSDLIGWSAAYVTPRSLQQWEDWLTNVDIEGRGVAHRFADGVAAVAARFRDAPHVIGIDLLNEPFAGAAFVRCFSECEARYAQLTSNYEIITERVRDVAPRMPVWWEPFTFGKPFQGTPPPGAGVGYTFHAYCAHTDGGEPVTPDPAEYAFCNGFLGDIVDSARGIRDGWNRPAIMGEFGASASPLNAMVGARLADEALVSWLHWGSVGPEIVEVQLVRPYAQATAGVPLEQSFDPATGAFEYRFRPDHRVAAPTSIVVPQQHYPLGYTVKVNHGAVTSAPDAGRLTIEALPGATEVSVSVERVS